MSAAASAARKSGSKILQAAGQAASTADARGGSALRQGAKRDPELYILLAVMSGAFGLAGWYFGRKPTAASSEQKVGMAHNTMPWQTTGTSKGDQARDHFKYKYHPGGDPTKPAREAPSALNEVVVPNVTLPKRLHDKYNKWGKEDW
ncbi:MAG: hypothetical protein M1816_002850 [Peltula sp. TS41687]|nr:MAG: hypothetical protein M1816_002850 [Peltula sp. TS41687]